MNRIEQATKEFVKNGEQVTSRTHSFWVFRGDQFTWFTESSSDRTPTARAFCLIPAGEQFVVRDQHLLNAAISAFAAEADAVWREVSWLDARPQLDEARKRLAEAIRDCAAVTKLAA